MSSVINPLLASPPRRSWSSQAWCGRHRASVPGPTSSAAGHPPPVGSSRPPAASAATSPREYSASPRPVSRPPSLISAVGDDLAGRALIGAWTDLGASPDASESALAASSVDHAAVLDGEGEVAASVADTATAERDIDLELDREPRAPNRPTPPPWCSTETVPRRRWPPRPPPPGATTLVLRDARDPPSASRRGPSVWFEPVSVAKSTRAGEAGILSRVDFVSPNVAELRAMAADVRARENGDAGDGDARDDRDAVRDATETATSARPTAGSHDGPHASAREAAKATARDAETLLRAGVGRVGRSPSARSASSCASETRTASPCARHTHLPALPAKVRSAIGAGTRSWRDASPRYRPVGRWRRRWPSAAAARRAVESDENAGDDPGGKDGDGRAGSGREGGDAKGERGDGDGGRSRVVSVGGSRARRDDEGVRFWGTDATPRASRGGAPRGFFGRGGDPSAGHACEFGGEGWAGGASGAAKRVGSESEGRRPRIAVSFARAQIARGPRGGRTCRTAIVFHSEDTLPSFGRAVALAMYSLCAASFASAAAFSAASLSRAGTTSAP